MRGLAGGYLTMRGLAGGQGLATPEHHTDVYRYLHECYPDHYPCPPEFFMQYSTVQYIIHTVCSTV